jgi:hypothetical protein
MIMISDNRIRELIALGTESRNVDYKGPFSWAAAGKDEKVKIVKDVLAFANARDGGLILVGVDDATCQYVGLSDDEFSSFDQTKFNDFVHIYTEPKHTCNVYRRGLDGKKIVLIEIPEFTDVPIVCKQEAPSSADPHKLLLRRATLYKRTDRATSEAIDDADELRELLNRALLRRQDELMNAINRIINPQLQPTPLARPQYVAEAAETDDFINAHLANAFGASGCWTVTFQPAVYIRNRILELRFLQGAVRDARVSLRGWDFPHLTPENASNFGKGFQSWVDWQGMTRMTEAFRAYESGFFRWKGALWEDTHPAYAGKNLASLAAIIFAFTEWFTFAQRYYERFLGIDDSVVFEFSLDRAMGRSLLSIPPAMPFPAGYTSQEDRITVEGTVGVTELRTDAYALARRYVRRVFEIFNWNTVSEDLIADWQKHIDGKY